MQFQLRTWNRYVSIVALVMLSIVLIIAGAVGWDTFNSGATTAPTSHRSFLIASTILGCVGAILAGTDVYLSERFSDQCTHKAKSSKMSGESKRPRIMPTREEAKVEIQAQCQKLDDENNVEELQSLARRSGLSTDGSKRDLCIRISAAHGIQKLGLFLLDKRLFQVFDDTSVGDTVAGFLPKKDLQSMALTQKGMFESALKRRERRTRVQKRFNLEFFLQKLERKHKLRFILFDEKEPPTCRKFMRMIFQFWEKNQTRFNAANLEKLSAEFQSLTDHEWKAISSRYFAGIGGAYSYFGERGFTHWLRNVGMRMREEPFDSDECRAVFLQITNAIDGWQEQGKLSQEHANEFRQFIHRDTFRDAKAAVSISYYPRPSHSTWRPSFTYELYGPEIRARRGLDGRNSITKILDIEKDLKKLVLSLLKSGFQFVEKGDVNVKQVPGLQEI